MQSEPEVAKYSLGDFAHLISGVNPPVIVGGQAVNLWCLWTMENDQSISEELLQWQPFISKDCDVLGNQETLFNLARESNLPYRHFRFGQPTPVIGFLHAPGNSERPYLEVLASVNGLGPDDIKNGTVEVIIDAREYRVLSPVTVLKAKLANAAEIPQEKRQDVRHVRMLMPCVRAYLTYTHSVTAGEKESIRFLKRILSRCLEVITSPHGRRVSAAHGIDLFACFPSELLKTSPYEPARNFWAHQLAEVPPTSN